jgi:hypothetical protein
VTCRNALHRFLVEWRAHSTRRWRIEQSFWTREAADNFLAYISAAVPSYSFRIRERKTAAKGGAR